MTDDVVLREPGINDTDIVGKLLCSGLPVLIVDDIGLGWYLPPPQGAEIFVDVAVLESSGFGELTGA